jgi:hypothetical protein
VDLNINLTILLSLLGSFLTLALYTTIVCKYFYNLNEKSIGETKAIIKEWREEHTQQLKENEAHWREMFTYMSGRIDNVKDGKPSQTTHGRS